MVSKRKIAIIFSNNNNFFQNPQSIELINTIRNNNYLILFCLEKQQFGISTYYKNDKFLFLRDVYTPNFVLVRGVNRLFLMTIINLNIKNIKESIYLLKHLVMNFFSSCKDLAYNLFISFKICFFSLSFKKRIIIGIDEYGCLMSNDLFFCNRFIKKIFVSHELYFDDEINPELLEIKKKAHKMISNFKLVISTDVKRLDLLIRNSSFMKSFFSKVFFCIPVSYRKEKIPNLIDKRFTNNIIYTGTISETCRTFELINLFSSKDELSSFNLYFNSYHKFEFRKTPENVFFPNSPITEIKDYINYIATFDIGFVLYYPDIKVGPHFGKNIEYIGLSSGKFSLFAMLGIPIICSPNSIYNELLVKYNFGFVIEDFESIPFYINSIYEDYEFFSYECQRLYCDILEPSQKLNQFSFHL